MTTVQMTPPAIPRIANELGKARIAGACRRGKGRRRQPRAQPHARATTVQGDRPLTEDDILGEPARRSERQG
jgi:hypothetical protein